MTETYNLPDAPNIPGLRFRGLNAPEDYANMDAIARASSVVDDFEYSDTVEDISKYYSNLANCDVSKDVLFAEVDGKAIGYSRVWFIEKTDVPGYLYQFFANLHPEWRGKGIRRAMLKWCESRIADIASRQPIQAPKEIIQWVMEKETDWRGILESENYAIVRYGFQMIRPDLENIPDCPLPEGIEVRPVRPEHSRMIWDADIEASKDGWLKLKAEEEWYKNWINHRLYQPELWQVAWDGDRVVGAVQNFIDYKENADYGLKRGWTENIHVGREWRGRGIAQALIARSFNVLKEKGMEQAMLGVDAENPTGALHLYKKMGFIEHKRFLTYKKILLD